MICPLCKKEMEKLSTYGYHNHYYSVYYCRPCKIEKDEVDD